MKYLQWSYFNKPKKIVPNILIDGTTLIILNLEANWHVQIFVV